jgi:hypothetical protein
MDEETHVRFLEYLELFGYFGRADMKKLGAAEFAELDAELETLQAKSNGTPDAAEHKRIVVLRRILLRD